MKPEGHSAAAPAAPHYAELLRLLDSQVEQQLNLRPAAAGSASAPANAAEPPATSAAAPMPIEPSPPTLPTAGRALVLQAPATTRPTAARAALHRMAWRAVPALLCVAAVSGTGWALWQAPGRSLAKSSPQPSAPTPAPAPEPAPTSAPAPAAEAAPQATGQAVAAAAAPTGRTLTPAAEVKDTSCSAAATALGLCPSPRR
jgi:hypothetical protein